MNISLTSRLVLIEVSMLSVIWSTVSNDAGSRTSPEIAQHTIEAIDRTFMFNFVFVSLHVRCPDSRCPLRLCAL
jgi:hypothetical protein